MIANFRCGCPKLKGFAGGCYKKSFEYQDDYDYTNMTMVLLVKHEKTYLLDDSELETEAIKIFHKHVSNLSEVVDSTTKDLDSMFGSVFNSCDSHSNNNVCDAQSSLTDSLLSDYENFRRKNVEDLKKNSKRRRLRKCLPTTTETPTENKFKFNWNVDVSIINKEGRKENKCLQLCRKSACFLYGIKENAIKRISTRMRQCDNPDIKSARKVKSYNHNSFFGRQSVDKITVKEINDTWERNNIDINEKEVRAGLVRASETTIDAMHWMEHHFNLYCYDPTSREIHIDLTNKSTIYELYLKRNKSNVGVDVKDLTIGAFKTLWQELFINVKIRKVKRVSGSISNKLFLID